MGLLPLKLKSMMQASSYIQIRDLRFKCLLTPEDISRRVTELGNILNKTYVNQDVVVVSVLNGAFMFTADLLRELNFSLECRFLRIQSYAGTASTGIVKAANPEILDLPGKHVMIIEDIVDTGRTMRYICDILKHKQVASLRVVTFLHKPEAMLLPTQVDHAAFVIKNEFVVGYGLDYDGLGRQLPALYQLVND